MPFPKTLYFILGVLVGVVGFFWVAIGGIAPPEPQDVISMDVSIAQLKPEDRWLEKVRFQVIPLDGVLSFHKYAILLMTPPPGGIPNSPSGSLAGLDLTSSADPGGIQPIGIKRGDFGPNGDQVAVKFIDELVRPDKYCYHPTQHLLIGSSPTP
jgi:hypothetical protein